MTNYEAFEIQYSQPVPSKRKRKKQIINDLKKQVSFYFSDSNLSKDKYLRDIITSDPGGYVSIETIEAFSRIQEINCSRKLLVKSMSLISELEINLDKGKIRRSGNINFNYNADDKCIYIENLPPRMDHKRLEQALRKYGTIMHISLPRFKNNKEFKGFGFVEFKTVQESEAALKGLGWEEAPSVISPPEMPLREPPKTLSIHHSTPTTPCVILNSDVLMGTEALKDEEKKKRRRRRSSICISELKTPVESSKRDPLLLLNTKCEATQIVRKRKRTSLETVSPVTSKARRTISSCVESDSRKEDSSDVDKKKKIKLVKAKRRKKKKQKLKQKSELQDIRVFPKLKWLHLKEVYKQLQKQQISDIKKDLGMQRKSTTNSTIKLCGVPPNATEDSIKDLFKEAVVTVYKNSGHTFVRFTTNPDSYKAVQLPGSMSIQPLTEAEQSALSQRINTDRQNRYLETKRKKMRGYTKVIRKCSAQDQTSHEIS